MAGNTPKPSIMESMQPLRPLDSLEGLSCCQIVRTKLLESYLRSFYQFKVIQGQKMVKNEPKIAGNTPKPSKTESMQSMGPLDSLEGPNCCQIVRTKLQESY